MTASLFFTGHSIRIKQLDVLDVGALAQQRGTRAGFRFRPKVGDAFALVVQPVEVHRT